MSRLSTIKTIASTLTVAVSIGFVAQYGETTPQMGSISGDDSNTNAPRAIQLSMNADGEPVFGVPNTVVTPEDHSTNNKAIVAVNTVYPEVAIPTFSALMSVPTPECQTTLAAQRDTAAMIKLTLSSPCNKDAHFIVTHSGLRVTNVTDQDGKAEIVMPALTAAADFEVRFGNTLAGTTEIFVPELRRYDRAILQWRTQENMRLHALENGAKIGESGHVWSASYHTPEGTRAGRHGFVAFLGDADADTPFLAEVYTFPAGQASRDSDVDLRVGIIVTDANCGREVDAETIQTNAGENLIVKEVSIQMPACDRVGEVFLVADKFSALATVSN